MDDNAYNLFALQSYLHPLKVQADEALNGEEAVNKLVKRNQKGSCRSYKLVLMDISMPVMDGVQAAGAVRLKIQSGEIEPVPLVALSGETMTEEEKKAFCRRTGFDEFIAKPITKDDFIKLLVKYKIIF